MPAVTTEGLILKRADFGEADRVLTVLTDRYGKISVIARGVRKITSRRAGNIELLNRVKMHLFKAKSYTLTEAESISTFAKVKENLILSTTAFHIVELINRLVPEDQKNPHIYNLTLTALTLLEKNPRQIFIRAFEVKLLNYLGFWSLRELGNVNTDTLEILEKLESGTFMEISKLEIDSEQAVVLEKVLRYYLEKVLESSLKSASVLRDLKK